MTEYAVSFPCAGSMLHGVVHSVSEPAARRGVLIIVGGPQYRVGSHRQFVLLARHLAAHGVPVLRFDYRGMGDSEGELSDFLQVREDIRAAIDCFVQQNLGVTEVVLWGLCDAASASCFYAGQDARVAGLVLLNPWVRTDAGEAKAILRHYYLQRITEPEFWRKVREFRFDWRKSVRDLLSAMRKASAGGGSGSSVSEEEGIPSDAPLADRMLFGLSRFDGPVLLILSGRDLTAREFEDTFNSSADWRAWADRAELERRDLPEADHTFSRKLWRDQVADWTLEWFRSR